MSLLRDVTSSVKRHAEEYINQKINDFAYGHSFGRVGEIYGYMGAEIPPQYIVTIYSKKLGGQIRGVIQDGVSKSVESSWKPVGGLPGMGAITELANKVVQSVTMGRVSAFNKITSRRMWTGTTPLNLRLTLKFVAEKSAKREVVEPVAKLEALTLPSLRIGGFLAPPGPSPFMINKSTGVVKKITEGGSDLIKIYVGTFLYFNNVVLRSIDSTFNPQFTADGYPISAVVNVNFETYEVITKEDLSGPNGLYQGIKVV